MWGSPHCPNGTNRRVSLPSTRHRWDQFCRTIPKNLWEMVGVVWVHFPQLFPNHSYYPTTCHFPLPCSIFYYILMLWLLTEVAEKTSPGILEHTDFRCLKPEYCRVSSTVFFHFRALFALHFCGGLPSFPTCVSFYQTRLPS